MSLVRIILNIKQDFWQESKEIKHMKMWGFFFFIKAEKGGRWPLVEQLFNFKTTLHNFTLIHLILKTTRSKCYYHHFK